MGSSSSFALQLGPPRLVFAEKECCEDLPGRAIFRSPLCAFERRPWNKQKFGDPLADRETTGWNGYCRSTRLAFRGRKKYE
jgi:hypothetical protein